MSRKYFTLALISGSEVCYLRLTCKVLRRCCIQDATDDVRQTQSRDTNYVTSGADTVTSSSLLVTEMEGVMQARRKSGSVVRQSPPTDPDSAALGGVARRHGDWTMTSSSGVVKDEKDAELMTSSASAVTSLKELELAGRTTDGKLDDVKARLTPH